MNALLQDVQPRNLFQSRPGPVGSVGDTVVKTRFRQSTPTMPWVYDPYYSGSRSDKLGSNVTDGSHRGYDDLGGPANTSDSKWIGGRSFKHQYGWTYHEAQEPDKLVEPVLRSLGDYSYRRKVARVRDIKRTGSLFTVKPMGFQEAGVLRSGNYPRVTQTSGGDAPPGSGGDGVDSMPQPIIPGKAPSNPVGAGYTIQGQQTLSNVMDRSVVMRRPSNPINAGYTTQGQQR